MRSGHGCTASSASASASHGASCNAVGSRQKKRHNGALSASPVPPARIPGAPVSTVTGENPSETQPDATGAPVLTVVRGNPSAEEIAALVAVLTARTGPPSAGAAAARPGSAWSARSRLLREPLPRGPDGWRTSALPR